jgi:hypothetical protein
MDAKRDLPRRDIELLSSYLDGELPAREAEKLEQRLRAEPGLRLALHELRQTVRLLRELPHVEPTRNYTLTAEMAGLGSRPPAYPVLSLATALAALAFFVVVGLDALSGRVLDTAREAQIAAPAAEKAAEVQDMAATETLDAELEQAAPTITAIQEAPMVSGEVQAEAEAEGEPPYATPTFCEECPEALGAEQPEEEQERAMSPPPTEGTAASAEPVEATDGVAMEGDELTTPLAPLEQSAPSPTALPASPEAVWRQPPFWTPLRYVEIGLGAVTLLLAGLTLWIRQRG